MSGGQRRTRWRWAALACGLAGAPLAPGRADDAPSCEPASTCDGGLAGRWRLDRGCIELVPPPGLCSTARIDGSGVSFAGTWDFADDGSFSVALTPRGSWAAHVPATCTMGLSCAEFGDAILASGQGAPLEAASCEERAGACACTFRLRRQTQWEQGSFAKAGTTLTLDRGHGETESFDHCASGDRMTIALGKLTVGTVSVTGDLVLRRAR
jgi:hypothetical protein